MHTIRGGASIVRSLLANVGGVLAYKRPFLVELAEVDVAGILVHTAAVVAVCLTCTLQRSTTALHIRPAPNHEEEST